MRLNLTSNRTSNRKIFMSTLHSLFKNIDYSALPAQDLSGKIFSALATERFLLATRERRLASLGMLFSTLMASLVGIGYGRTLFQSDFWSLSALLFSDMATVLTSWDSFLWSLMETLPTETLALFMLPLFLFLISFGVYSKSAVRYPRLA